MQLPPSMTACRMLVLAAEPRRVHARQQHPQVPDGAPHPVAAWFWYWPRIPHRSLRVARSLNCGRRASSVPLIPRARSYRHPTRAGSPSRPAGRPSRAPPLREVPSPTRSVVVIIGTVRPAPAPPRPPSAGRRPRARAARGRRRGP